MKQITAEQGQTWDMIAKLYMGDEIFTKDVMLANCDKSDIAIFDGGEVLNIPEGTDTDEE
ncbi:MAG: phage tail protein [Lachnospiraceae bacterium]|nr:phage tail protein [Lachnospiraceae bacterium]